jgi:hypothetical protein
MRRKRKIMVLAICVVWGLIFWPAMAKATLVNSNSLIQDNIEYYMQTDKAVYNLGEGVQVLYRVTNLGVEDVTFQFTCGPVDDRRDFMVDRDGERIWDNLDRPRQWVITSLTLSSLESKEFTWPWDMTDFNGNQVVPGNYDVIGVLGDLGLAYAERYVPVSVSIDIIPEPATLALLGLGAIVIRKWK